MTCRGICFHHRAPKPVGSSRYATGQKRCQNCEIFMRWNNLWCPCCGSKLRTKSRNSNFKQTFRLRTRLQTRKEAQLTID